METYQIVVPALALGFIALVVRMYTKGNMSLAGLILWALIWSVAAVLALFPDSITQAVAQAFGIKSNINAALFLALGILFFIQFYLFTRINRQNRVITDLVRRLALRDEEQEGDKRKP